MKILCQGIVKPDKLEILMRLTRLTSDDIKEAVRDHFVKGMTASAAADFNGVPRPNLTRAINRLDEVAEMVERCKEIDLYGG